MAVTVVFPSVLSGLCHPLEFAKLNALTLMKLNVIIAFFAAAVSPWTWSAPSLQQDTTFVPRLYNGGEVQVVAKLTGGQCVVGGAFDWINGQPAEWLARLNAAGDVDNTFQPAKPFDFERFVTAVPTGDGKLIIGYTFAMRVYAMATVTNAAPRASNEQTIILSPVGTRVVRLNQDGSIDSSFQEVVLHNSDGSAEGALSSIVVTTDNKLLMGGGFAFVNGGKRTSGGLIRVNTDGTIDTSFKTTVSGGAVLDLQRCSDGCVMVAGKFTKVGKTKVAFGLARLKANGSADTSFVPRGKTSLTKVSHVAMGMAGTYLAAFSNRAGTRTTMQVVKADGSLAGVIVKDIIGSPVGISLTGGGQGLMICTTSAQDFSSAAPNVRLAAPAMLVSFNATGKGKPRVEGLGFRPNGFYRMRSNIIAFGTSGISDQGPSSMRGFDVVQTASAAAVAAAKQAADVIPWVGRTASVSKIAPVPGSSKVIVSGYFTFGITNTNEVVDQQGLARLLADGSIDPEFRPAEANALQLIANADGGATLLGTVQPGPAVDVAPGFVAVQRLLRLTSTGEEDATFAASAQESALVLARQSDGKLLVGSQSNSHPILIDDLPGATVQSANVATTVEAPPALLARYLDDGQLDTTFAPMIIGDAEFSIGSVNEILAEANGGIVITGYFGTVDGSARKGVARFKADGSLDDQAFTSPLPAGFTKILPRGTGYLALAPYLQPFIERVSLPSSNGLAADAAQLSVPIFIGGEGSTRSPFLGLTSTGAEDTSFTVPDLKATGLWSWFGNGYGVQNIVPSPTGGWIAMTRGLKDTVSNTDVSLVHVQSDGTLNRQFVAPELTTSEESSGGIWWWGPRYPADLVDDLCVKGNSLYLGGAFWAVDGEARSGLTKLNLTAATAAP